MSSKGTKQLLSEFISLTRQANRDALHAPLAIVVLAIALIVWRVWTFTILPALRPQEPKEVPYWIPFLGHAVSFFRDSHGTLTYGREYFGDTREPFAITVAGERLYIVTSPQDVAAAYKNTSSLTFDDYIQDMMLQFGATPGAVKKMWTRPSKDGSGLVTISPNPLHKTLAHLGEDFYRQQLYPGKELDVLQMTFLQRIRDSFLWENMSDTIILSSTQDTRTVSLLKWCQEVLLDSATRSFFGDRLLELEPNLFESFFDFDDNSWKLTYHLPRFLSKEMFSAKEKATDALRRYLTLPREQRPGEAWLIRTLEAEMRQLGIEVPDIASFIMMIYWVINGNAYKLCFWILTYVLHHPSLHKSLLTELQPVLHPNNGDIQPDMAELVSQLERLPHLNSLYNEVLRLTASSSSVRTVSSTTTLGGKSLRVGTKVLIPYRQLHFNEEVFGNDAKELDPDRFLRNKELARSSSYRPFGGGTTYCPGRFLAKKEVLAFVALALGRFEVSLDGGRKQAFPKLEEKKPCLGIMGPMSGEDVRVRVRRLEG